MALVVKDRVQETTTSTGTGTITLAGAVTGFQSFSVIGNGNTTYYAIVGGSEWEVGLGTYTSSGTTLSRNTVLESSNGGTAVNFSAGIKNVFCTYPAEKSLYLDGSGNAIGLGTVAATTTLTNATGLPLTTGVTGTLPIANGGTGTTSTTFVNAATNITGTLPVANGGTGVTTSTGSGNTVLSTSPTLVTPNLGTPSAATLTNATGLPLSTGVTGTLATTNGGTGLTTVGTANQVLTTNGTTLSYAKVGITNLSATGSPSASTFLRGDNTWGTVTGGVTQGSGGTGGSFPNSWPLSSATNGNCVDQTANCSIQNCGDFECNIWQIAGGLQTYVDSSVSTMLKAINVTQRLNCVRYNCNCNC